MVKFSHPPHVLLIVPLFIALLIYLPGLYGDFVFDDVVNILLNSNIAISTINLDTLTHSALSSASGPLKRPISMLSFALNHYAFGHSALYYKLINLLIHLVNGILVYLVLARLFTLVYDQSIPALSRPEKHWFDARWLALAVATIWLLHPFNLTSVLYIVQRMTSLSVLFTLLGLLFYLQGRRRQIRGQGGAIIVYSSIILFTPLAALSKEIGLLLPVYCFLIEILLLRFTGTTRATRFLMFFYGVGIAVGLSGIAFILVTHPTWLSSAYAMREFTLHERLLTEARVLWFYLSNSLFPNISSMGLFHDDIAISTSILHPASTLLSVIGIGTLVVAVGVLRNRLPLFAFGIAVYLVGHSMESTFLPLELVHEHRNYFPIIGVLVAITALAAHLLRMRHGRIILSVSFTSIIVIFSLQTLLRADQWAEGLEHAVLEVTYHPNSAKSNYRASRIFYSLYTVTNEIDHLHSARQYLQQAHRLAPNDPKNLIGLYNVSAITDESPDQELWNKLLHILRYARFPHDTASGLNQLVDCALDGRCKIDPANILLALEAASENPYINNLYRASFLSSYGRFVGELFADYDYAIEMHRKAIELDPQQLAYSLNLARLLALKGDIGSALQTVEHVRTLDRLNARALDITWTEEFIAKRQHTIPGSSSAYTPATGRAELERSKP